MSQSTATTAAVDGGQTSSAPSPASSLALSPVRSPVPLYHVVLHFDVNKTLIMDDIAGKKSFEDILNEVISEVAWGRVVYPDQPRGTSEDPHAGRSGGGGDHGLDHANGDHDVNTASPANGTLSGRSKRRASSSSSSSSSPSSSPSSSSSEHRHKRANLDTSDQSEAARPSWVALESTPPSVKCPQEHIARTETTPEGFDKHFAADGSRLMTFSTFVHDVFYPFDEKNDSLSNAERIEQTKQVKAKRSYVLSTFTEKDNPGHSLAPHIAEMKRALLLPKHPSLASPPSRRSSRGSGGAAQDDEYVTIVPSFYNLVLFLHERGLIEGEHLTLKDSKQSSRVKFSFAFRTFGNDIQRTVEDMDKFCTGRHPLYPHVRLDGTNGTLDMRLKEADCLGCFYRCGPDSKDCFLVKGSIEKPPSIEVGLSHFESQPGTEIVQSFSKIHQTISEMVQRHPCIALRDYFDWWSSQQQSATSGKLLLVGESSPFHSVFFDDNFRDDEFGHIRNIVDVRDIDTEQPVQLKESINRHVFTVYPFEAILNPSYFVDRIRSRFPNVFA